MTRLDIVKIKNNILVELNRAGKYEVLLDALRLFDKIADSEGFANIVHNKLRYYNDHDMDHHQMLHDLDCKRDVELIPNVYLKYAGELKDKEDYPLFDFIDENSGFTVQRINLKSAKATVKDINTPYAIMKNRLKNNKHKV